MSDSFLGELRIQVIAAVHQLFDDHCHLHYELKLLFLLLLAHLKLRRVLVKADGTGLFCPLQSLLKLFVVIDTLCHTTDNFNLIYRLHTHSQVFLDEFRADDGSADTHGNGTNLQVGFSSHACCCYCGAAEAEQFCLYVLRDGLVVSILYVMSVDTKCRKSLLCVGSQYGSQVYSARSLGSVQSPYALDGQRIGIHGLGTVAPAGSYGQGNVYACLAELVCACCCLTYTSDGSVCDNNLYRLAVGITDIFLKQLCCCFCHVHGLLFQRSSYVKSSSSSVDSRTDTNYRIITN